MKISACKRTAGWRSARPRGGGRRRVPRCVRRRAVPFADFMPLPEARNWFFGSGYLDFATPARSPLARYEFFYREPQLRMFWRGMGMAC